MIASAKDLRFNINLLFDVVSKGEDVTITYRGKPKAKLISSDKVRQKKDDSIFGMLKDDKTDVNNTIRDLRKGRNFGI